MTKRVMKQAVVSQFYGPSSRIHNHFSYDVQTKRGGVKARDCSPAVEQLDGCRICMTMKLVILRKVQGSQGGSRFFIICHIHNHTGYNQ